MKRSNSIQNLKEINLIALVSLYTFVFITLVLVQKFSHPSASGTTVLNTLLSLAQAPLMLMVLMQFNRERATNLFIGFLVIVLLAFYSGAIAAKGIGESNLLNMMLVSALPVAAVATALLAGELKSNFENKMPSVKTFMLAAILFGFGSYAAILSLHHLEPARHAADIRIILGLITLLSTSVLAISMAFTKVEVVEGIEGIEVYETPAHAGFAQWENFTLTNTPDMIKKGVTDISKYYKLQKTS
jgi:drug/metabolite transporter (DMT)-like permease